MSTKDDIKILDPVFRNQFAAFMSRNGISPIGDYDWKRLSKTGSKGSERRVFWSDVLPFLAVVQHHPQGIPVISFEPLLPWDYWDQCSTVDDNYSARRNTVFEDPDYTAMITPDMFVFTVMPADGMTAIMVCPKSYWEANGYAYDQHIDVNHFNIPYLQVSDSECYWMVDESPEQVIRDLAGIGMVVDPKFINFMNGDRDDDNTDDGDDDDHEFGSDAPEHHGGPGGLPIWSRNPADYEFVTGVDMGETWISMGHDKAEDQDFYMGWTGIPYMHYSVMEQTWSVDKPEQEVIDELKAFGFIHNPNMLK